LIKKREFSTEKIEHEPEAEKKIEQQTSEEPETVETDTSIPTPALVWLTGS